MQWHVACQKVFSSMDRLSHLNPSQRDAATTLEGPLLILAGAGTGKTRVITHRIVELIASGVSPDRILSVSFTNKAAGEMLERTVHLLGKKLKPRPFISTFHSLCVRILRQDIPLLGYPTNFVIYDRGDQESAARKAMRDIRLGEKSIKPSDFLSIISRWKTQSVQPEEASSIAEDDQERLAAAAYRRYQTNLKASGAVDFDDLLLLTVKLFHDFPDALLRWQQRFEYVQIDEYQDTNGIQFHLVESLVRQHKNLCVVGDDDQSIYGWRGAEVEHILGFHKVFPGTKIVRLQDNYRCTEAILKIANRLVKNNKQRHDKELIAHKVTPDQVRMKTFPDELKEAEFVVNDINYFVTEMGVQPQDFAILVRTNDQPRVFEQELRKKRLPYVVVGAQSFFDRREIRDIMAYLKVLSQPDDEMSLLRIINTPSRGIGETSIEKLLAIAVRQKKKIIEVVPDAAAAGEISPGIAKSIQDFYDLMERFRKRFQNNPGQMAEITQALLSDIDYESEINKQYKEPNQQLIRVESLNQIIDAMKLYITDADSPNLRDFLDQSTLNDQFSQPDKTEKTISKGIKLMTLHSAKGLEFPRVYLVGLEEGILPHYRSLIENTVEEERRLAYVGVTRARDHLTITHAKTRMKWGKKKDSLPSRFIYEMIGKAVPPQLLAAAAPDF
jgi:DNA helicase-2/ATP-dependent DNA helicase PcrA